MRLRGETINSSNGLIDIVELARDIINIKQPG